MRRLDAFLEGDYESIEGMLSGLSLAEGMVFSAEDVRERLASSGRTIERLNLERDARCDRQIGFLSADSSTAVRELRYHALWGVHSTCVYAVFDGLFHDDALVGHGKVCYRDLLYSTDFKAGSLVPYSEVDGRCNSLRVYHELSILLSCLDELISDGKAVDYILIDGSIQTNLKSLSRRRGGFKEDELALDALKKLRVHSNLVGLVEDSHATDLAGEVGFECTNMLMLEVGLEPGEYVVDERDGVSICYAKMPQKMLSYLPSGKSNPITVRWEFNKVDFREDLNTLAGLWMLEDDLLHPQLYPTRIADYMSRKIKAGGLLDCMAAERGLESRHREMREG